MYELVDGRLLAVRCLWRLGFRFQPIRKPPGSGSLLRSLRSKLCLTPSVGGFRIGYQTMACSLPPAKKCQIELNFASKLV
jgi:hypothetical protein